jgi:hypothetical protein
MPSSGGGPGAVTLEPGRPLTIRTRETPGMHCPRCQHENRPQAKFCEECAGPLTAASPTAQSDADLQGEVENLRRALSEALERQPLMVPQEQPRWLNRRDNQLDLTGNACRVENCVMKATRRQRISD